MFVFISQREIIVMDWKEFKRIMGGEKLRPVNIFNFFKEFCCKGKQEWAVYKGGRWGSIEFLGFFFLKMEGRTAYLYHHLDNIEEKILEGAESGELLEKHLWASKRCWDLEEPTLARSMDSPWTVPDRKQRRSTDAVEAVHPFWLSHSVSQIGSRVHCEDGKGVLEWKDRKESLNNHLEW